MNNESSEQVSETEGVKRTTNQAYQQFKKGGGRFFKMQSRVEDDYVEVDGAAALKSKCCIYLHNDMFLPL